MNGCLTRLSDSRWVYKTALRMYVIRQCDHTPNCYEVEGPEGVVRYSFADSVEDLCSKIDYL